jgi:transmembrane sensor
MTEHRLQHAADLRRMAEQAASWYLDQRDGLSPDQQAAFMAWLRESPLHVSEYLAMAQMHGDLSAAAALDPLDACELTELASQQGQVVPLRVAPVPRPAQRHTPRRVWPWHAAMTACLLAVAAPTLFMREPEPAAIYTGDAQAIREVTLADGTQVTLDRGSLLAVRYDASERRIRVARGAALFDVAHESRPLRVSLGNNVLEDVGTVFDARLEETGGSVTVLSGRVRVWPHDAEAGTRALADLGGGQRVHMSQQGQVRTLERHADLAAATAWLPADIHFQNATVADVAQRFHSYGAPPLLIEDAALAQTRISGRFHARDVDAFIAYLRSLPGVTVQHQNDAIRIDRAPAASRTRRL